MESSSSDGLCLLWSPTYGSERAFPRSSKHVLPTRIWFSRECRVERSLAEQATFRFTSRINERPNHPSRECGQQPEVCHRRGFDCWPDWNLTLSSAWRGVDPSCMNMGLRELRPAWSISQLEARPLWRRSPRKASQRFSAAANNLEPCVAFTLDV